MSNPIADPFVENAVSSDLEGIVRIDGTLAGAVVLTLNGPGNALDGEVAGALKEAFETLQAADHVRVVFLLGTGGSFFSGPLTDWARIAASDWSASDLRDEAMIVAEMLHALTHIPALTVAVVDGEASGVGAGLAAACDMAVATFEARFSFPEVKNGAVAAMAAPYVVNAIGPRLAKTLFMTGRAFDATYAEQIGLVQQISDVGALGQVMERLIDEALRSGPEAMHAAKRLVWEVWGRDPDRGLMEETARSFAKVRFSDEGREGLDAAIQGRAPSWASLPL
jgi:methylglutaconyl-CoA hydratase